MAKGAGVREVMDWKFESVDLPPELIDHLGELPQVFRMYIDGEGGSGKTEYEMILSAVFAIYIGKVAVNNAEQKKHKGIMQSARRNLKGVPPGKWMYHRFTDFEKLKAKIRRPNSGKIWFIDSISYFPLSEQQVQELFEEFPNKSFVLIAYEAHFSKNRPIRHLCDIKVRCKDYVAIVQASRFGGGKDLIIYPEKAPKRSGQISLFGKGGLL